tara:strand:- start:334 stop:990 length:657 start_codon:yes stop_codon:yes gene_type:complete
MNKQVVCITTAGRTGSNFLCDIYVQNGFSRFRGVWNWDFNAFDKPDRYLTFQNDTYVINNDTLEKVVFHNHDARWLPHISKDKIKVILCFRKNKILQQMSQIVWEYVDQVLDDNTKSKTGPATAPNPDYTDPIEIDKLYVDPRQLLNGVKAITEFEELALKTVQDNQIDYSIIYYEDLFSDKQSDILQELGIIIRTKPWFQKSRFQARDIIENYKELL